MKLFYTAVGPEGKKVSGFVEATDLTKAALYLRERSMIPIRIESQRSNTIIPSLSAPAKIKSKDLVFFTRQISTMLNAGLTLTQSMDILKNQVQKDKMAMVIQGLINHIEEGKSLSDALAQFPHIFSPIYISLIRAGESSGLLDKVMFRLADSLEKQDALRSKIRGALVYPVIVLTLMFVVVIVMMLFVIPQISTLYVSMNLEMPFATQIVISMSELMTKYLLIVLSAGTAVFLYFNKWRQSDVGKYMLDRLILKLPIVGKMVRFSLLTEFSRTFGLLVGTGALVIDGLNRSAEVMGNVIYKRAVLKVSSEVEKGISIGDAMNNNLLFPPLLVEMVKIGEQTGKLDDSLTRVSEYFERESEQIVSTLTTAMEPFIMVVLAVGVGFLIISIITPIYNLLSAF
jgi:type IV pilus assembly protein PilC